METKISIKNSTIKAADQVREIPFLSKKSASGSNKYATTAPIIKGNKIPLALYKRKRLKEKGRNQQSTILQMIYFLLSHLFYLSFFY